MLVVHAFDQGPESATSYVLADPGAAACAVVDPVPENLCAIQRCIDMHGYLNAWLLHTHPDGAKQAAAKQLQETNICARSAMCVATGTADSNLSGQYDYLFSCGDRFRLGAFFGHVLRVSDDAWPIAAYVFDRFAFVGAAACDGLDFGPCAGRAMTLLPSYRA